MAFGLMVSLMAATAVPQAPPVRATTPCELHLWPAERLEAVAFSLYNGLIQGRASEDQIKGSMGELLSPASQVAAIEAADPAGALGLPAGTSVIAHPEPLDRKSLNKMKMRRAASSSPCYAELTIMQHALFEDIVWGDRFISTFMFRDFGGSPQVKRTFKGPGGNKLKVLTLNKEARPDDAAQLVDAAVRANFLEYARNTRPKIVAGR